jgi:hypothetical protein
VIATSERHDDRPLFWPGAAVPSALYENGDVAGCSLENYPRVAPWNPEANHRSSAIEQDKVDILVL